MLDSDTLTFFVCISFIPMLMCLLPSKNSNQNFVELESTNQTSNNLTSRTISHNVTNGISYEPVKYASDYKGMLIVVFTDIGYLPATIKWYEKMMK